MLKNTQPHYQEDILRMTIIRRFDVEVGTCASCGRQAEGRHPLQTSDSLRVGEVQVGPEAVSMAAVLNKELRLSHGRMARALRDRHQEGEVALHGLNVSLEVGREVRYGYASGRR